LLVSSLIVRRLLWVGLVSVRDFRDRGLGDVDRAQHVRAADALNGGRIVDATGNIFELFVANRFWLVGFFAHIRQVVGLLVLLGWEIRVAND
jgi:hypothetical protein